MTMAACSRRLLAAAGQRWSRRALCPLLTSLPLNFDPQNSFSTAAIHKQRLPPNLEIDKRSSFAPLPQQQASTVEVDHDEELQEGGQDDDEDGVIRNDIDDEEPQYVIPLPDRLFVKVYDKSDATEVGSLYLSEYLFGHDDIRIDLLQRTVHYQRNQARGKRTAKTKTIGEVSGSGRKVRQQKGTGQARAGHSRPAHWRGGAKAHGPKGSIQDYANCKLNKKVKRLALCHALSQKLKENNLLVWNDLDLDSHKTKELDKMLWDNWNIGSGGSTAYLVDQVSGDESWKGMPVNLVVASSNLYSIKVSGQRSLNVYDILRHEKLVLTVRALEAIEGRLIHHMNY